VLDEGSKAIKSLKVGGNDLSYLGKMQHPMESLEVLDIDCEDTAELGVKTLLSLSTKVNHLTLDGLQLDTLGMTGQEYKHLKHLLMYNCSSTSDHLQSLLVNISSTIEQLVFDDCEMKIGDDFKCRFPKLKRLELYNAGNIQDVSRIIKISPKLQVERSGKLMTQLTKRIHCH